MHYEKDYSGQAEWMAKVDALKDAEEWLGKARFRKVVKLLKKTIAKDRQFEFVNDDDFYKTLAKTPRSNCVMSNEKLLSTGIKMRSTEEALQYCVNNWVK